VYPAAAVVVVDVRNRPFPGVTAWPPERNATPRENVRERRALIVG
jgi:hypothetical protein